MSKPQTVQFGNLPATNAEVVFGTVPAAAETIESAPSATPTNAGADPDDGDSAADDAGSGDTGD